MGMEESFLPSKARGTGEMEADVGELHTRRAGRPWVSRTILIDQGGGGRWEQADILCILLPQPELAGPLVQMCPQHRRPLPTAK